MHIFWCIHNSFIPDNQQRYPTARHRSYKNNCSSIHITSLQCRPCRSWLVYLVTYSNATNYTHKYLVLFERWWQHNLVKYYSTHVITMELFRINFCLDFRSLCSPFPTKAVLNLLQKVRITKPGWNSDRPLTHVAPWSLHCSDRGIKGTLTMSLLSLPYFIINSNSSSY